VTGIHTDSVRRWNLWFPSAGVFAKVLAGRATGTQITSPLWVKTSDSALLVLASCDWTTQLLLELEYLYLYLNLRYLYLYMYMKLLFCYITHMCLLVNWKQQVVIRLSHSLWGMYYTITTLAWHILLLSTRISTMFITAKAVISVPLTCKSCNIKSVSQQSSSQVQVFWNKAKSNQSITWLDL